MERFTLGRIEKTESNLRVVFAITILNGKKLRNKHIKSAVVIENRGKEKVVNINFLQLSLKISKFAINLFYMALLSSFRKQISQK